MFEYGKKEEKKEEKIEKNEEEIDLIQEQIENDKKELEKKKRLNARLERARNRFKNKTQNNPFYKSVEVATKASELEKVLSKNNNFNENNEEDIKKINTFLNKNVDTNLIKNNVSIENLMESKPIIKRHKKKMTNFTIKEDE
jgi:hypothetical protein